LFKLTAQNVVGYVIFVIAVGRANTVLATQFAL
jgi:hypothetical protein